MDLVGTARDLAESLLGSSGRRWDHIRGVGRRAESMSEDVPDRDVVVAASWLHDVGYAAEVQTTGFHPLDGARWLTAQKFPASVVGLVAFHTGAETEADERDLGSDLAAFARPRLNQLDMLNFLDLTTSPDGAVVTPAVRIAEILGRYGPEDPVHRAVTRSRDELLASAHSGEQLIANCQPTQG